MKEKREGRVMGEGVGAQRGGREGGRREEKKLLMCLSLGYQDIHTL